MQNVLRVLLVANDRTRVPVQRGSVPTVDLGKRPILPGRRQTSERPLVEEPPRQEPATTGGWKGNDAHNSHIDNSERSPKSESS